MRYLYQAQPGLEVVVCEDDGAIVDAIDERTLLVPISHVLFKTGEIQEIEPIIRRAHEVGAHVILDCYQSAGIVPFDVAALNVDFAVEPRRQGGHRHQYGHRIHIWGNYVRVQLSRNAR